MKTKGYEGIPSVLCDWITFLCQGFPARSIKTFIELLFGSMLSPAGFVCQALLHIQYERDWTAYYKWIERGHWSWLALARQMAGLVICWFDEPVWHLIIDDTLVLRASKKAPGVAMHHPHGNKVNQADYVRAQCWVALAVTVGHQAIPLLMRLAGTGNHGKLATAHSLLRVMAGYFRPARLLLDCWYMRGWLIEQVLAMGLEVIGQVRIDTALFEVPAPTGKRGRPRKYGERIDFARRPEQRLWLDLYGQQQWVRIRSGMAAARFLHGRLVRWVWTQFERTDGRLTLPRLILSTETGLSGEEILAVYAKRWSIEPMFNQLKNSWGMKQSWQQTKQVLARWVQVEAVAYGLMQLLTLQDSDEVRRLAGLCPWRVGQPLTAGQVRLGLARILGLVNIRQWWDAKSRKFGPPDAVGPPNWRSGMRKAA
jgi:hypothetical protein